MRYPLISLVLLAAVPVACDDGLQRGQFTVSGSSSRTVAGVPGSLTIIRGDRAPHTTGGQPLLYILALAPSIPASGSSSSHEDGTYVSTHTESWDTAQGKVEIRLTWDRRTDKVSAGGGTFDRQKGNVFVLIRDAAGKVAVTQVGPMDAGLDEYAALPQIQAALPANSPAKGVALVR